MKKDDVYMHPLIASLLSMISGGMDVYTFMEHGGVFPGLQTGNTILLSISIGNLDFIHSIRYILSIGLFLVGVIFIKSFQNIIKDKWLRKTIIIIYEILIVLFTGIFIKQLPDIVVIGLLSLVASAQLQEFRLLKGNNFNPLMMTGNIIKIVSNVYPTIFKKNKESKSLMIDTLMIYTSFIIGSIAMGLFTRLQKDYAIFLILIPLFLVLLTGHVLKRKSL